jgi:hypothetical protein
MSIRALAPIPAGFFMALPAVVGCGEPGPTDVSTTSPDPIEIVGDPVIGQRAFEGNCAGCHASRDGFDLAFFAFPDTTIVRRAVAHVDTTTAFHIVSYVRSFDVPHASRVTRPFQPGGRVLASDQALGAQLFGSDTWPADLTTEQLRAMDPRTVAVAIPFPLWSSEGDNLDWMPDLPLADHLLDQSAGRPRALLEHFYETGTLTDLVAALKALRQAESTREDPDAPCVVNPPARWKGEDCFQVRRWTASLAAQYMLRHGLDTPPDGVLQDTWWATGAAARNTEVFHDGMEHGVLNWVAWQWLGWSFAPATHQSLYLTQGLERADLRRHATFHALRAQVARPRGHIQAYHDARAAAQFGHPDWMYEAISFAYRHLEERIAMGDRVAPSRVDTARGAVHGAYNYAESHLSSAEATSLQAQRDRLLGLIGN